MTFQLLLRLERATGCVPDALNVQAMRRNLIPTRASRSAGSTSGPEEFWMHLGLSGLALRRSLADAHSFRWGPKSGNHTSRHLSSNFQQCVFVEAGLVRVRSTLDRPANDHVLRRLSRRQDPTLVKIRSFDLPAMAVIRVEIAFEDKEFRRGRCREERKALLMMWDIRRSRFERAISIALRGRTIAHADPTHRPESRR